MNDRRIPPAATAEHPSAAQAAAFVDRRLEGAERSSVAAHLARCAECRQELIDVRQVLDATAVAAPLKRRRRAGAALAGAGVAAAAVLLIGPRLTEHRGDDAARTRVTRAAATHRVDSVVPIPVVHPADGASIARDSVTLTWHAAGVDAMYLLTVQDTTGSIVWNATMTDTSVVLPPSAPLASQQRYFWSVDARLGDGQATKTGVRFFTVR